MSPELHGLSDAKTSSTQWLERFVKKGVYNPAFIEIHEVLWGLIKDNPRDYTFAVREVARILFGEQINLNRSSQPDFSEIFVVRLPQINWAFSPKDGKTVLDLVANRFKGETMPFSVFLCSSYICRDGAQHHHGRIWGGQVRSTGGFTPDVTEFFVASMMRNEASITFRLGTPHLPAGREGLAANRWANMPDRPRTS